MDDKTIAILSVLLGTVCSLFLLGYYVSSRRFRFVRLWLYSIFLMTSGTFLLLFQGVWHPFISIILSNGFVISGVFLMYAGCRNFSEKPERQKEIFSALSIFLAAMLVFTFLFPSTRIRIILVSSVVSMVNLLIGLNILDSMEKKTPLVVFNASVFFTLTAFFAFRTLVNVFGNRYAILFSNTVLTNIMFVLISVCNTAWSLGLILLHVEKTQVRLEVEMKKLGQANTELMVASKKLKESECTLATSEQKYRLLFSNLPSGLAIYRKVRTADFRNGMEVSEPIVGCVLEEVNPAFTCHPGLSIESLRLAVSRLPACGDPGRTDGRFSGRVGDDGSVAVPPSPVKPQDCANEEILLSVQDGDGTGDPDGKHWFSSSIYTIDDDRIGIIHTDVTDRVNAERKLRGLADDLEKRVSERTAELEASNRELRSFAYSVSHDLRSPLRAMEGFSSVLLSKYRYAVDPEGLHYLERIREGARRMGTLINDLLELTKVTRGNFERVDLDLASISRRILARLGSQSPGRNLITQVGEDMYARGDERLVTILLEHLLDNAVKFTSGRPQAVIEAGVENTGGERIFFVKDNGVGFDMSYCFKLFEPFGRLHGMSEYPGVGIGLVTAQRIVIRHGGRIWAEGETGKGATFRFTLEARLEIQAGCTGAKTTDV